MKQRNEPTRLSRILPITGWLPSLDGATIRMDLIAGAALAGLLAPEGMAYAGIAGVPPEAGLYSAAAGLAVYALFGSSRHLAVSCTSGSAAMLAALVAPMAAGDPGKYAALASATAIATGLLFLVASIFRLGFVSEFISRPVLKGFVFGLGLTIMIKQAPKLLGIHKGHGDTLEQAWQTIVALPHANPWTALVGGCALAVVFGLGVLAPRVPGALVVFVLGIVAVRLFGLERFGVEVVGKIPSDLPHLEIPKVAGQEFAELFTGAIGVVLIIYAEAI